MNYQEFIVKFDLMNKTELDKIKYTMYYLKEEQNINEVTLEKVREIFQENGIHISNFSRLKNYVKKSSDFKKVSSRGEYCLTDKALRILKLDIKNISEDVIITDGILLDINKFCGARGYLDNLILQVNHCYENNCFDACAILMRRILEILLILTYQKFNIDNQIKNADGSYKMLEKICDDAKNNAILNLSRTKKELDSFRNLGNYAAHKIEFLTAKSDIDLIKLNYRTILEELYYKSGLKK